MKKPLPLNKIKQTGKVLAEVGKKQGTGKHKVPLPKREQPLWQGPTTDGITFSLLNRFLECRERFRLRVVEGIVDDEGFQRSMEYGSMWHACEEALAGRNTNTSSSGGWVKAAQAYRDKLLAKYPDNHKDIQHWYQVCRAEFPVYITEWQKQQKSVKYLLQETAFRVPYLLPSGRTITLRGKWDAIFQKGKSIFLQENKTKGEIDEEGITQTVDQNLQVMFYLIALQEYQDRDGLDPGRFPESMPKDFYLRPLAGVLYNVIRRPLADRYAIRQKKSETPKEFYARLQLSIYANPEHYFKRWEALISKQDIQKFKRECFTGIMCQLDEWWEHILWTMKEGISPFSPSKDGKYIHYRTPYGIYHSLAGGFRGSYFSYLTKGSTNDLRTITTLYPELEE
jgi:hypothetical protein